MVIQESIDYGMFIQSNGSEMDEPDYNVKVLKKYIPDSVQSSQAILMDDFHKFRGNQPQIDDITFIMLKYK